MAYTVPPTWGHGSFPLAADLNILSNDLTYLNGVLGDVQKATPRIDEGDTAVIVNVHRWLHYETFAGSAGVVHHPTDSGQNVSLTESASAMAVYDLQTISWMTPGLQYKVGGVEFAAEDQSA